MSDNHDHEIEDSSRKSHWDLLLAIFILIVELTLQYRFSIELPSLWSLILNVIAYLLAGRGVLMLAGRKSLRGDFFNEFVLMSVATIGAFVIKEYEEGVAVMVFYQIGEWFQDAAVNKAKRSIKALLDIRPDKVSVVRNGSTETVEPSEVNIGETISIKPGEKVALDGELLSEQAAFNTAALTGESKPDTKYKGETVLAGMINLQSVAEVEVKSTFKDSKLSRILEMVQDATARKSETQLFISKFAKIYTPIVFLLALAVFVVPYFIADDYSMREWFYRSLVFLVISCPCALVVSSPLGYFGGIGLASKSGILFKGSNFLDVMTRVDTVVMDKTGTLTKGVFSVQQVVREQVSEEQLISYTATLEGNSTHPVGKAIIEYAEKKGVKLSKATNIEEIAGHGLKGKVEGADVLAGNAKLLKKYNIEFPIAVEKEVDTIVVVAIDGKYAGYFTIADEIKQDAKQAVEEMHGLKLTTVMLSGDKQTVVDKVAKQLGIDKAYGNLLPEDKVAKVEELKQQNKHIAFVGDGVNDAPVVALADAGIAMGGLGSDATIETADIVIQNDQPTRIISAIRIGRITRRIVWQNIIMAMTVKVIVLMLGAGGVATLWEAVIADVGVALLAILNAVRIQTKRL